MFKINSRTTGLKILLAMTTALASSLYATAAQETEEEEEMDEIVVTSSKMNRKLDSIVGSVTVMTSEEMEKEMISGLGQLFKNQPGVSVTGDTGQAQNVVIRGMSGDRVLMIKDGMRMNEGYGANGLNDIVGRGFIDLSTIKQVEVAKGPASSLYGADAMGGIVIFTTKDASDYLRDGENLYVGGELGYSGENDEFSYLGTVGARYGKLDVLLSATKRDGHETQNFKEEKGLRNVNSISVLAKTKLFFNDTDYVSFIFDLWDQNTETPDLGTGDYGEWLGLSGYKITYIDSYANQRNESYKFDFHYEGESELIESLDMSLYKNKSLQQDGNTMKLDVDGMFGTFLRDMFVDSVYDQNTSGFLSNLVGNFNVGEIKNQYAFGVDIEKTSSGRVSAERRVQDGVETRNNVVNKFPDNDVKRFGVYFNDYMDFLDDRLSINFGIRYDYFKMTPENTPDAELQFAEISEDRFSTNAGLLFKATDVLSLVGNFSQGFKVPPYDLAYIFQDNTFVSFGYGYVVHPVDSLVPETSNSIELGVRVNTEKLDFSAYVFQNDFKNFIEIAFLFSETLFGFQLVEHFEYQNIDAVRIKGAEASISYQATDALMLFANMAFQDGKNRETGRYITSIEPLSGTVGASYNREKVGFNLNMRWATEMTKVNEGAFINPGYVVFDFTSNIALHENVTLRLGVFNMFNKEYTRFQSVTGMSVGADTSIRTRPGRSVNARVSFAF